MAVAVGTAAVATDLVDHCVHVPALLGGALATGLLLTIDRVLGAPGSTAGPLLGALAVGGIALVLNLGGRLYARLRGLGGDDVAFGNGDILIALLMGAAGGVLLGGAAFVAGIVLAGLAGLVAILSRSERFATLPLGPFLLTALAVLLAVQPLR